MYVRFTFGMGEPLPVEVSPAFTVWSGVMWLQVALLLGIFPVYTLVNIQGKSPLQGKAVPLIFEGTMVQAVCTTCISF